MVPSLQCPKCSMVCRFESGQKPVCSNCGFGSNAAPVPAQNARPIQAATHSRGKPRSFGASFWLGVITFGIYWIVWKYKVFKEVDDDSRQEHNMILWLLGFILGIGILMAIYEALEINKLNNARAAKGMAPGVTGGMFVLLYYLGLITLGITTIVGYAKVQRSLNEYWAAR